MIYLRDMPLRRANYRVLAMASLGQLLGSGLATLVGVIMPLLEIGRHPELTPFQQGLTGCVSLIGIMTGSLIFGRLTDRYGYLFFYRLCPALTMAAALPVLLMPHWGVLTALLFVMGLGVGGEYCLDSDYISELMPKRWKLFMVGVAKATSALGSILFALVCFIMMRIWPVAHIWPWLFLTVIATTLLMLLLRIRAYESPAWLMSQGRVQEAETTVKKILGPDVEMMAPEEKTAADAQPPKSSMADMLKGKNLLRAIFCGIPWACEGLGVYGIGVFLPVLCMALGFEDALPAGADAIQHVMHVERSVELTTLINFFMLPGFVAGLLLMRRMSHVKMQTWGFIICALGLILLLMAYENHWNMMWAVAGFCIFELFLNAGPHLITFVLPTQIYPVSDRSQGSGLASCLGKVGAVLGVFFIPMLLSAGGARLVLWVSIGVMLFGALLTAVFGRLVMPAQKSTASK